MTALVVRRVHGAIGLFFAAIALLGSGVLVANLAGMAPAPLEQELHAYLLATLSAVAVPCAALSWRIVVEPERAKDDGLLTSLALFGLAAVRLATWLLGAELAELGLGPAMVVEVAVFSGMGTAAGMTYPGAAGLSGATAGLMRDVRRLPSHLWPWLAVLVPAVTVLPALGVMHPAGQAVLLANLVNLVGFVLYDRMGLSRGLSWAHLLAWPAAFTVIVQSLPGSSSLETGWLAWLAVGMGGSLLLDAADAARWTLGDRAPLVAKDPGATKAATHA